jgi:Xaa-Pro aminopeptidase
MRSASKGFPIAMLALLLTPCAGAQAVDTDHHERRERAAREFPDGLVLLHASPDLPETGDGFRQDPIFFYFTGLADTVSAILAIDGPTGKSWLFIPSQPPFAKSGLVAEVSADVASAKRLNIEHVLDWSALEPFLASRALHHDIVYFVQDNTRFDALPANLLSRRAPEAPSWLQVILRKWPTLGAREAGERIRGLLAVQSPDEIARLRLAAQATVQAFLAGLHEVKQGVSQRRVELAVVDACWEAGAHGEAFWPWAMAGTTGVFPTPFTSLAKYDHLDQRMRAGDLVRLDVGCEWDHYGGDLGRTLPVSGVFAQDQGELWDIFVDAYRSGAGALRAGVTVDELFGVWQSRLISHRDSARSALAKQAIETWSDRRNLPYWQVHTTNLTPGSVIGPLRSGTTINFEPIAAINGQGYFLEDMYLVTEAGAERLTPGIPESAAEIESSMAPTDDPRVTRRLVGH